MTYIDFSTAKFIKDLIWYDGPLLCQYELNGKTYLMSWVDVAATHTWLIIEVRPGDLERYLAKEITLLNLERRSPNIYKHDGFCEAAKECPRVDFEDLPEEWVPSEDSYFFE